MKEKEYILADLMIVERGFFQYKKAPMRSRVVAVLASAGAAAGVVACGGGDAQEQMTSVNTDTPITTRTIEPTAEITATPRVTEIPTIEPTENLLSPNWGEVKTAVIAAYNSVGFQVLPANIMTKLDQCDEENLPGGIDFSSYVLNACGTVAGDMNTNVSTKASSDEQAVIVNRGLNLLEKWTYWKPEDHLQRGIITNEQAENSYLLIDAAGWFPK